jgi:uncharacterized membrane protein
MKYGIIAVMLAYPFLVYGGLSVLAPRSLAIALGGILLARAVVAMWSGRRSPLLTPIALIGLVTTLAAIFDDGRIFLFVPVLINAALLVSFAWSHISGASIVESLARRQRGHLTPEDVRYCRRVTEVWCLFFVINGGVTLWLALRAPLETWTFYTGVVSQLLVGALFVGEVAYRSWRFRRYDGAVTDPVFRRLFPPKPVS